MTAERSPPFPLDCPVYLGPTARWLGVSTERLKADLRRLSKRHPEVVTEALIREGPLGPGGRWLIRSVIDVRRFWPSFGRMSATATEASELREENKALKVAVRSLKRELTTLRREMDERMTKAERSVDRAALVAQGLVSARMVPRGAPARPSPWDEDDGTDDIAQTMAEEIDRGSQDAGVALVSPGMSVRERG